MNNTLLENRLIDPNIVDIMTDYVSIQIDIDERKVKAAALVAQDIDIKRIIKKENLERCTGGIQEDEGDEELRQLLLPAWSYYTYSRCLIMFPGTFTDSGYVVEEEATDKNVAKSVASEMKSIAEAFMDPVLEYLEDEKDENVELREELTPSIRVFGGNETRASN